jgi:ATP-dependent Clp protease ATP-binding subunit ClpA
MDEELDLKLNADTRNILQRAEEEARGMGDEQVSTLHVLLALMQYAKGPWNLLVVRKVTPDAVRAHERTECREGQDCPLPPLQMKVTQALSRVAWNAAASSRERPDASVTPERLLEALITEPGSDAVGALRKLEFDIETLKSFLYKFLHSPPKPAQRRPHTVDEDGEDITFYFADAPDATANDERIDELNGMIVSPETNRLLRFAEYESRSAGALSIGTHHVLIAFVGEPNCRFGNLLRHGSLTVANMRNEIQNANLHEQTSAAKLPELSRPFSAPMLQVFKHARQGLNERTGHRINEVALLSALLDDTDNAANKLITLLRFNVRPVRTLLGSYLGKIHTAADVEPVPPANIAGPKTHSSPTAQRHLSRKTRIALERAQQAAVGHGIRWYGPAYALYGLAATPGTICSALLDSHGAKPDSIKAIIAELTPKEMTSTDEVIAAAEMIQDLKDSIKEASAEPQAQGGESIEPEHLLLAILRRPTKAVYVLKQMNIDPEDIIDDLLRTMQNPEG